MTCPMVLFVWKSVKKIILSIVVFLVVSTSVCFAKKVLRNQIMARVNGVNILKYPDVDAMHVDAKKYSLEDAITQELYVQEAVKRKLLPSQTDVEKHVAAYKSSNNITTDEELEENLKKNNFTSKRYKSELARYIASSNLMQVEIKARIFVTKQEIENYHDNNPEWKEQQYLLKTCIVPFADVKDEEELLKKKDLDWIQTDWLKKSSISEKMSFVFDMEKGKTKYIKTRYGYQLVVLEDKKESQQKKLEERYVEIEKKLRFSKMEKFEQEFRTELKGRASIEYLVKDDSF